jgi:cytochrome c556
MFSNTKSKALSVACLTGLLLAGTASLTFAAGESVEAIIKARQTHLKDLGAAFKTVRDQTRKSEPEMAQVKDASAVIAKAASEIDTWFPKGSGPDSKFETDAKAEIWADPAGFATAAKALKAEAPKLQQLANANDVAGVKAQAGKLGGACKGCHDKYRVPQD